MDAVTIRELRNHGGHVLDLVTSGGTVTVTRDGRPVAELRPLPRQPLKATALLAAYRHLPRIDAARLKADLDAALDPSL